MAEDRDYFYLSEMTHRYVVAHHVAENRSRDRSERAFDPRGPYDLVGGDGPRLNLYKTLRGARGIARYGSWGEHKNNPLQLSRILLLEPHRLIEVFDEQLPGKVVNDLSWEEFCERQIQAWAAQAAQESRMPSGKKP